MSFKIFIQEIEKGLKLPAYLLYADNHYLTEEALSAVRMTIPDAESDFILNVFDMDSPDGAPSTEQITTTLNTIPFLGNRRHVIVKSLQKLSVKEFRKLQPYLSNPSPASVFIMLYTGALKKELKELLTGVKTICLDIREQDIPVWIKDKTRQKGIKISDEAVEYLIGIVGDDIGLLCSELEKLSSFSSESITIGDIREIVEGSREYSPFDLVNTLKEKNTEKVFRIYRVLSETSEPYSLLGVINWHYSRISAQTDRTKSGMEYFDKVFRLLNEADIQIKTSGGTYPMEYLLVRLLQL